MTVDDEHRRRRDRAAPGDFSLGRGPRPGPDREPVRAEPFRGPLPNPADDLDPTPVRVQRLAFSAKDLVQIAVRRLLAEGVSLEHQDLEAFGYQGLLEAALRYEPERGEFRRFAYFRVRGAMLDGVRKMGSWSRRGYERVAMLRALDSASESLGEGEDAASLTADQAAERLRQHMASVVTAVTLGIFAEGARDGADVVGREPSGSAEDVAIERQLQLLVGRALAELPEPEVTVVRRHYLEGHCLDDIAADLGCSRSWASRLHTRALKTLGERLRGDGD